MNFGTLFDSLLAILGFSMLVVIHEFGHFAAARWAGVRVLTFAVGFGRAIATYRQGLGFRFGSSEADYLKLARAGQAGNISPTEYRLNMLPFGGYVKMLGQDDLAPNAISDAPDSYQMCKPWKRMVIISAGVVMNVLAALVLFMIVFGLGLKTEAPVIGDIALGSPAAQASSVDPKTPNGLRAGDRVLRIDGDRTRAFNEIVISAAMASRGDALRFEVERPGLQQTLQFDVTPRTDSSNGLPTIGVGPAAENTIVIAEDEAETKVLRDLLDSIGLTGVEPGMKLVKAGSIENPANGDAVEEACHASGGNPVQLVFEDGQGKRVEATVVPRAELASGEIRLGKEDRRAMGHIAGLVPVLRVGELSADTRGYKAGLRTGDIFEKVGDTPYPSMFQGVSEIRSRAGGTVDLVVLRKAADGTYARLTFPGIAVSPEGQVGIVIETTAQETAMVAMSPAEFYDDSGRPLTLPANNLIGKIPSNLISVNGKPVQTLIEARRELQDATRPLITGEVDSVKVDVMAVPLGTEGEPPATTVTLEFGPADAELLHRLGWVSPFGTAPFERSQTLLKASTPFEAISMGFTETHKAMLQVYVTFLRLFEGTVQVKDLKGPVGIAHVGTLIARKGWIWLMFFFALISVNLAVVNFLPLPIVDGGQLLLLIYESIRGKPAPLAFQNAVAIAGLVVIGTLFLFITFHDIRNLLGI
jgi:regulator of sigma E protease